MVGGIGDPAEDRTRDLRIKSPLLYQLSYRVGPAKVRAPRSAAQARLTGAGAGLAFYRRMSPRIVPVSADTPITHVSDTARWVAMYRAWEGSLRPRVRRGRPGRPGPAARALRPDRRGRPGSARGDRGAAHLPRRRQRGRPGGRPTRAGGVPVVADRPRVSALAADDGQDVGAHRGGRERAVPLRARGGDALLHGARLARGGVPLDLGRVAAAQADRAARLAVELHRALLPAGET